MKRFKKNLLPLIYVILFYCSYLGSVRAQVALDQLTLVDGVEINLSQSTFNRRTNQQSFIASLTNNGSESLQAPIYLAIDQITSADVNVANNDDVSTTELPLFTLNQSNLSPGSTIQITLVFNNPTRVRFNFSSLIYIEAPVDNIPPVLQITAPLNGSLFNEPLIAVTGSVSDESSVIVTVNGVNAAVNNGTFSADILLIEGENLINANATDAAGNITTETIQVTLQTNIPEDDTTPPTATIKTPSESSLVTKPRRPIELTYDDPSGVDLTNIKFKVNGNTFPTDCQNLTESGGVCTPLEDFPQGTVILEALISDLLGNEGSYQTQFTVDTESVEISITAPQNRLITKNSEITVTGSVGSNAESVLVNGITAAVSQGAFSAQVPLREGDNMLVAVATKASGLTSTDSVDVTLDIQPPSVRITTPSDGFLSSSQVVPVAGLINDIVDGGTTADVFVNGVKATVSSGSFLVPEIKLLRGSNSIQVTATDSVGNVGSHRIQVTYQEPVGQRISLFSGNGQSGTVNSDLPEPLVAKITDQDGNPVAGKIVEFTVIRNTGVISALNNNITNRTVRIPTDGSGQASVLFSLGETAGQGNNRVRAKALGVSGEVEFCASSFPLPTDKILATKGMNQRGQIGQPAPEPLEALIVDKQGNPIQGVDVTFSIIQGDGHFNDQKTQTVTSNKDGIVRAAYTLGQTPGINGNRIQASLPGLTALPATFVISGFAPGLPENTRFSGVVLDNALTPIPNARVFIPGSSSETFTNEQGLFELTNVPVGHIHLHIDSSTSPRPETFPELAFETDTIAGQNNNLGQPISIPSVDTDNSKIVGGNEDVVLTMEDVPGLELKVFANSVTFPNGDKTGRLTISQVHLDKVPMPPPSGTFFMPPAWTIQPAGTIFDPPAQISIPNDGMLPGRSISIFQFDHEINEFINIGPGTTSDDGMNITSDPGFGIIRAGWGGCGQPQPPTTDGTGNGDPNDEEPKFCDGPDAPRSFSVGSKSFEVNKANSPVLNIADRLLSAANLTKKFEVKGKLQYAVNIECCNKSESLKPIIGGGVSANVDLKTERIKLIGPVVPKEVLSVGIFLSLDGGLRLKASSVGWDFCENVYSGSGNVVASVGANVSFSIGNELKDQINRWDILKASGEMGADVGAKIVSEGIEWSGNVFAGPITASSEVEFIGASIKLFEIEIVRKRTIPFNQLDNRILEAARSAL